MEAEQNILDLEIFLNWDYSEFDMEGIINDFQNPYPKPMDQWNNDEVIEFILNEISFKFTPAKYDHLERFQCISGYIFKSLTEDNCKKLSNSAYIGEMIFNAKEKYIRCHPLESIESESNSIYCDQTNESSSNCSNCSKEDDLYRQQTIKKQGRPRCKPITDKMGKRSEKVWEFLLHLLRNRETCPKLIKWENFDEGTFKFVQSDKVARLWGSRKKNENMTYDKFSRAMRYYYKSKVLLPVPGKRLVYKFGPQAKGWKNITPIC